MIFSIVDTAAREVIDKVCGPQEAHLGLCWAVGERNLVFYANDVRIEGRYHKWVQDVLIATVAMLRRVGIETNLEKNKYMVFIPNFI